MKNKPIVFFRDDDVAELDSSIIRLIELFQKLETPLSLEVVPQKLEKGFIDYFYSLKSKELFDIGQHGYAHIPYRKHNKNKGEFGSNRTNEEKRNDIIEGKKILDNTFGNYSIKSFVPPWGLMDQNTYEILRGLNYETFSCIGSGKDRNFFKNIVTFFYDPLLLKKHGMIDLSVSMDNMRYFEKKIPKTTKEMIDSFKKAARSTKYIGIMLHDKVMNDDAFKSLEEFILYLKSKGITIMNTSQILKNYN